MSTSCHAAAAAWSHPLCPIVSDLSDVSVSAFLCLPEVSSVSFCPPARSIAPLFARTSPVPPPLIACHRACMRAFVLLFWLRFDRLHFHASPPPASHRLAQLTGRSSTAIPSNSLSRPLPITARRNVLRHTLQCQFLQCLQIPTRHCSYPHPHTHTHTHPHGVAYCLLRSVALRQSPQ